MPTKKSLKQALREVQDLQQKTAVYEAAANWLKTRYVSRDSMPAISQISCAGAPVSEGVIELVASEILEMSEEMDNAAKAMMGLEVDDD